MSSYSNVTPLKGHDDQGRAQAPPHDIDAERGAIGAVLLTGEAARYALDAGLTEEAFYEWGHRAAWRAVKATLDQRPATLSTHTVVTKATLEGMLEDVSTLDPTGVRVTGKRALIQLEAAGSLLNYRADIDAVLEHYRRRRTMECAVDLRNAAERGLDIGPALASLEDLADTSSLVERYRRELLIGRSIYDVPALEPLIDGVLDLDTLAAIYGPSGSGKSYVALDMALRVARGEWWNGHAVEAARTVLYVVAEGVKGMEARVKAWYQAHTAWAGVNDTPPDELVWLPLAVNLLDAEHVDAVGRLARDINAELVIFDTLNRCMPGADENGSRDMGAAVDGLDRVRRLTGACVVAVHHTGKDTTKGMRGHTSLLAALDTALEVKSAEYVLSLSAEKQKYREGGRLGRFTMKAYGDDLALEPGASEPVTTEWLIGPVAELDAGDGVRVNVIMEATGKSRASVYAALKVALEQGLVEKVGKGAYRVPE